MISPQSQQQRQKERKQEQQRSHGMMHRAERERRTAQRRKQRSACLPCSSMQRTPLAAEIGAPRNRRCCHRCASTDPIWAVRTEAATQLGAKAGACSPLRRPREHSHCQQICSTCKQLRPLLVSAVQVELASLLICRRDEQGKRGGERMQRSSPAIQKRWHECDRAEMKAGHHARTAWQVEEPSDCCCALAWVP